MNKFNLWPAAVLATVAMTMANPDGIQAGERLVYPAAPSDGTVDEYFGIKVADPYRPLENDTAAVTLDWVAAENAVTDGYLSKIPFRAGLRRQIEKYNDYTKQGAPWRWKDGRYYFYRNDGLKNQSVLYRMDAPGQEPTVVLDPNALSEDGTVALTGISMSKDGKHIAYTISRSGSDWTEIYVLDAATLAPLPDISSGRSLPAPSGVSKGLTAPKDSFTAHIPAPRPERNSPTPTRTTIYISISSVLPRRKMCWCSAILSIPCISIPQALPTTNGT